MGFWSGVMDIFAVVAAPATFGISLLASPTARSTVGEITKAIGGEDRTLPPKNDSSNDHISKEQNRINELVTKNQEDLLKKLKELQDKTGVPQPIDRIKGSQNLTKEEIHKLIEEARNASPERRKEIIDEITTKVQQEQTEADKILKEARNKLEKLKNQTLAQAQGELQSGNKTAAKTLYTQADKQAQTINEQNKIIAELKKKEKEKANIVKNVVNDAGKGWLQNIDFTSWKVWVGGSLIIFIPLCIYFSWKLVRNKLFPKD